MERVRRKVQKWERKGEWEGKAEGAGGEWKLGEGVCVIGFRGARRPCMQRAPRLMSLEAERSSDV